MSSVDKLIFSTYLSYRMCFINKQQISQITLFYYNRRTDAVPKKQLHLFKSREDRDLIQSCEKNLCHLCHLLLNNKFSSFFVSTYRMYIFSLPRITTKFNYPSALRNIHLTVGRTPKERKLYIIEIISYPINSPTYWSANRTDTTNPEYRLIRLTLGYIALGPSAIFICSSTDDARPLRNT